MKLSTITNRGTKKDFIDLAFLLEQCSLQEMIEFYRRKFSDGAGFPVLKSLVFFARVSAEAFRGSRVQ